MSLWKH